jgi:hypothetical protein
LSGEAESSRIADLRPATCPRYEEILRIRSGNFRARQRKPDLEAAAVARFAGKSDASAQIPIGAFPKPQDAASYPHSVREDFSEQTFRSHHWMQAENPSDFPFVMKSKPNMVCLAHHGREQAPLINLPAWAERDALFPPFSRQ